MNYHNRFRIKRSLSGIYLFWAIWRCTSRACISIIVLNLNSQLQILNSQRTRGQKEEKKEPKRIQHTTPNYTQKPNFKRNKSFWQCQWKTRTRAGTHRKMQSGELDLRAIFCRLQKSLRKNEVRFICFQFCFVCALCCPFTMDARCFFLLLLSYVIL